MNKDSANEDIDFEPEEELGIVGAVKAKMQKLKDELEKVKMERQEYLDGWQRCKADSVNARRDALLAGERAGARSLEALIESLIPALDGFDMAAGSPSWESVNDEWRKGVEHIRNQILDVLSANGVRRFGKVGEHFDPRLHEAVQEVDDLPGEAGTVVRILRSGYATGERVLRPAQVLIKSHGPTA